MRPKRDPSGGPTPLREDYRCTPQSVASHTLYENADPFALKEPSGTLRTDKARYEAISNRAVRVSVECPPRGSPLTIVSGGAPG